MIKFIKKLFFKKKRERLSEENTSENGSHTCRVIRGYVSVNHLGEPILGNLNSMCFTAEDYLHHCTTTIGTNEAIDKAWEDMKEVSTVGYEELRERTLAEKECSQCTTVGLKRD